MKYKITYATLRIPVLPEGKTEHLHPRGWKPILIVFSQNGSVAGQHKTIEKQNTY